MHLRAVLNIGVLAQSLLTVWGSVPLLNHHRQDLWASDSLGLP